VASYHGNAADDGLSEMLSDLKDKLVAIVVDVESVENLGKSLTFELDCVLLLDYYVSGISEAEDEDEPSTTAPMTW
jgi:hypothetical protein